MSTEAVARLVRDRKPEWLAWLLGGSLVLIFFARDFLNLDNGLIESIKSIDYWGRDFINVWTGGHLVREGRLDVLYDLNAYVAYQRTLFGPVDAHNYSYPPVSFPLAAAFSLLPYWLSLTTWLVGSGMLFVYACRRWWPEGVGPVWLAVLTPAAIVNVWAGHYGFLMGALFLLGWQWLDEHPRRAGIAFGLMLIKPHLAVLIPLALLVRRDWTAIVSAAVTVVALVIGTTLWFGWQPWHDFLFRTTGLQASMIDAGVGFFGFMSTSTATAMLHAGASWTGALLAQTLVGVAGAAMVAVAAYRKMPTRDLAWLVATCTFLVLPYAFNYDLTVVCIGAVALMNTPGVRDREYRGGCHGFMCPQVGMITAAYWVSLTPLMLLGLAFAQFRCWGLRRRRGASGDAAVSSASAFAPA